MSFPPKKRWQFPAMWPPARTAAAKEKQAQTYTGIVCAARCDEGLEIGERAAKTMRKVGSLYFYNACHRQAKVKYDAWKKDRGLD